MAEKNGYGSAPKAKVSSPRTSSVQVRVTGVDPNKVSGTRKSIAVTGDTLGGSNAVRSRVAMSDPTPAPEGLYNMDDGPVRIPTGVTSPEPPKTRVVKKGDTSVTSREFNPNMFDPAKFFNRIERFYARHQDKLKSRLKGKGKSTLKAFIKDSYVDHFSSPQVGVGCERLTKVVREYVELEGDIAQSLLIENIMDDLGYNLSSILSGDQENIKVKQEEEDKEIDYEEELQDSGPRPPKFTVISETVTTKIIPIEELDKGLRIDKNNRANGLSDPGSIHILNTGEFESCKKFKCTKFSLVSMANMMEKGKGVVHPAYNTLFKTCCDNYNESGCPQGNKYDEIEQLIYDTAMETINNKTVAHSQVLAYRVKKSEIEQ
jgi:hypothetical protein